MCVATAAKECCWSLYASCMFASDKGSACSVRKAEQPHDVQQNGDGLDLQCDNLYLPVGQATREMIESGCTGP